MAYALEQGLQVGFTIPRRDVVIELEKRIKEVFPTKKVVSIYQNHSQELVGDIIVLTTHQLYRYKSYFDLLIIDEVDAFPFKDNYILNYFFNRSLKGNYIVLSATPSKQLIEEIKNEKGELFSLTKRYHNHPLIVPSVKIKIFFKKLFLIGKIRQYKKERKKLLVFVSTKDQCEYLFNHINIFCPKGNYVHSERKNRNKIIEEFKNNKYDYLITTSVLERGITISFLQVIVYDADHFIFDADTLIQISGRVGRKIESWDGEVIFLANKQTKYMSEAINKIKEANNENFL
jgi:competence protein ComFA